MKDNDRQFILCFGNPLDGFEYIGTFKEYLDAQDYGEDTISGFDWWIIELQKPSLNGEVEGENV